MEFRLLEYFLAVAREQNITAAAESLHISQPALSTQLKAMEMELGKQLLIRGVKGSRKIKFRTTDGVLRQRTIKSVSASVMGRSVTRSPVIRGKVSIVRLL